MVTIAIAERLQSARLVEPLATEASARRWGQPIWAADLATPLRDEGPTPNELRLAALAVAWAKR
jgi:hypothetical protein